MDRRAMRIGLLDDAEWQRLYQHNALFRAGLDQMIEILPIFLEGLAAYAKRENDRIQARIEALRAAPPMPFTFGQPETQPEWFRKGPEADEEPR